jgi:hypothetical protein
LTFGERLSGQEAGDIKDMLSTCDTMASIPSIIKNKQSSRSIPERGMQFSEKCVLVILGLDFFAGSTEVCTQGLMLAKLC